MRLRTLICLSALLSSLSPPARAQSADDLFHGGAQLYLSNNISGALGQVENGLKLYPDDVKLKKLEELLKRQNQQQQQQQQQTGQSQGQKDQNQPQPSPSQKPAGQEKKPGANEKPESSKAHAAGEMTPEEAKQLLDSQTDDELMLPVSRKQQAADQQRPIKDW